MIALAFLACIRKYTTRMLDISIFLSNFVLNI